MVFLSLIGKYYPLDIGFMLKSGLITPYRRACYSLKEYSKHPPQNFKELFYFQHFHSIMLLRKHFVY